MKQIFKDCMELDKVCRNCGTDQITPPHHIIYKSQGGPDELWNLITFCANCHAQAHGGVWHFINSTKIHLSGRAFVLHLLIRLLHDRDFRWEASLSHLKKREGKLWKEAWENIRNELGGPDESARNSR